MHATLVSLPFEIIVQIMTFIYATDLKTLRSLSLSCRALNAATRSEVITEAFFHQVLRAISRSLAFLPTRRRRRQPLAESSETTVAANTTSDTESEDDREQFAGYPSWFVRQRVSSWPLRWRHAVLWAFNRCVFCARSIMSFGAAPEIRLALRSQAPDGLVCGACVTAYLTALRSTKRPRTIHAVTFWCVVRGRDVEYAMKPAMLESQLLDPLKLLP